MCNRGKLFVEPNTFSENMSKSEYREMDKISWFCPVWGESRILVYYNRVKIVSIGPNSCWHIEDVLEQVSGTWQTNLSISSVVRGTIDLLEKEAIFWFFPFGVDIFIFVTDYRTRAV